MYRLTPRQQEILRLVVREHARNARPVGSRTLVDLGLLDAAPSTVRGELGRLEELGLLEHPHTSAGRVPTDAGFRYYVDRMLDADVASSAVDTRTPTSTDVAPVGAKIDEALEYVTEALAEATHLLALVTAPAVTGTVIRHVEVVLANPRTIVVVCITETGDVTRHLVRLDAPADAGLVAWAGEYLNDRVTGMALGQNILRARLDDPELSPVERDMIAALAPAFIDIVDDARADMFVGGTGSLMAALGDEIQPVSELVAVLEERRRLLASLRALVAASDGRVAVRIGTENELPELHPMSLVATSYGTPTRRLGMVGVIGPRGMDYPLAVAGVNAASEVLGRAVEQFIDS